MNRRQALGWLMALGPAVGALGRARHAAGQESSRPPEGDATPLEQDGVSFWVQSSLSRVFPASPPRSACLAPLLAARNDQVSFQACARNHRTGMVRIRAAVREADGFGVEVRRVGYVPLVGLNTDVPLDEVDGVGNIPGFAPDPLFPEETGLAGPEANAAFWITLRVPEDATPGQHTVTVRLTVEDEFCFPGWTGAAPTTVDVPVQVQVSPWRLAARRDFPVTHWVSADSIWEWYRIEPAGERFWQLAEAYLANLVAHGVNVAYTPLFNNRHELLDRPAQLLRVRRAPDGGYELDFRDVARWTRAATAAGAEYVEWTHFFTPAPTSGKHPQRIYERRDGFGPLLWPPDLPADSPEYRGFLGAFMPRFERFLREEGLFDRSLFHCADEPDGPEQIGDYRTARGLLREYAPWMQVMDAMSDTHFATERLTDMPVPSITTALAFAEAGCPAWTYFCCGPRGRFVQRFHDTPLPKLRMMGWLFYRHGARGFLHWGHNYWFRFCTKEVIDPFQHADVGAWPGLPYGDPFVVYPGPDGPIDSIRWEVQADSLRDYALLQGLGVERDDPLLAPLRSYEDFPKTEEWLAAARAELFRRAGSRPGPA